MSHLKRTYEKFFVTTLVKYLDKPARIDAMDAVKAAFPFKGEKQKNNDMKLSRFSFSQVLLDAFHPQNKVIFPACGCGSFRRFFISLPAGFEFSGRRSGGCPGSAAFSAAGKRSSRRRVAEDAALCFLCVRRECKKKPNKQTKTTCIPPYILRGTTFPAAKYVLHYCFDFEFILVEL